MSNLFPSRIKLKIGCRVAVTQLPDANGNPCPDITGIVYAVDYRDKKTSTKMTSFRMGVDEGEHTPAELMASADYATWEIHWINEIFPTMPTVEELLTHRCGIIRSMGTRRVRRMKVQNKK